MRVNDIDVAASSTVVVAFEADVGAAVSTGTVIANTASITHTASATATDVSSADVVVGSIGTPASGIKPLYFADIAGSQNSPSLPMDMARTPLGVPSNPERVRIRRQDNDRVWRQTPALQADLSLDAQDLPVILQMRRNNNTSNRNIRVTVTYSGTSNGFFGCLDRSLPTSGAASLSNSVTRAFQFDVPQTDTNCTPIGNSAMTLISGYPVVSTGRQRT